MHTVYGITCTYVPHLLSLYSYMYMYMCITMVTYFPYFIHCIHYHTHTHTHTQHESSLGSIYPLSALKRRLGKDSCYAGHISFQELWFHPYVYGQVLEQYLTL